MKKWIIGIAFMLVVIGIARIVYVKYPRTIDVTLAGVKYQLGSTGAQAGTEPATVVIQGKLRTSLRGERIFKGKVEIVGDQMPVPEDQRKVEIPFFDNGWGGVTYPYFTYNARGSIASAEMYTAYSIFANKDFSQVTLLIADHKEESANESEGGSMWNTENGKMFSAPASTREEAVALSNKLMSRYMMPIGKPLQ